jgi:hypothetical protein
MKREITILFFLTVAAFLLNACSDAPKSNANNQPATAKSNIQFADATQTSGVNFKHAPTRTENKWLPEIMGSGVGVADFNRDGAPDIVLVGGGAIGAARPTEAKNRLYINDGKGKFTDKTDEWKLRNGLGNRRFRRRRLDGFVFNFLRRRQSSAEKHGRGL